MTPQQAMEGSWQLELWNDGEVSWKVPDAHGRFVLRDGVVIFMATRPLSGGGQYSRHAYGFYRFDNEQWSYGYHQDLMLWETNTETRVSHDLPWLGMKPFAIYRSAAEVRLETSDKRYRLLFEERRFSYYEDNLLVRRWTRI